MEERLKIVKYINDPIYGGIGVTQMELDIIDTPVFQRLRGLRQLARVNFVFPSAEPAYRKDISRNGIYVNICLDLRLREHG